MAQQPNMGDVELSSRSGAAVPGAATSCPARLHRAGIAETPPLIETLWGTKVGRRLSSEVEFGQDSWG